jgi:crossover junction endodeoxyribonuclease RuvC
MFMFRATPGQQAGKAGQMRILGIDPGLRCLGWGVIESDGPRLRHIANGTIKTGNGTLPDRLLHLARDLRMVIAEQAPTHAAIEQTFVNKDGAGTLKLGQARGVALLVLAEAGLEVGEYAPNSVKKTVVGVGHADKVQVAHMVGIQLPGVKLNGPDAADALAIAICHLHHGAGQNLATALAKASA